MESHRARAPRHSLEEGLDRDRHQAPLPPVDVGEGLGHIPGRRDGVVDREHEKAEKLCQRPSWREGGRWDLWDVMMFTQMMP